MNDLRQLKDNELITDTVQRWDIGLKRWVSACPEYLGKRYNPDTMPLLRINDAKSA